MNRNSLLIIFQLFRIFRLVNLDNGFVKTNKKLLFFLSAGILFVISCTKDKGPQLFPPVPVDLCDSTQILYCNKVKPIIDQNCAKSGCHVAGANFGDFTTYGGLKTKVDNSNFRQIVIVDKVMPLGSVLSNEDLATLSAWLDNGAKEN